VESLSDRELEVFRLLGRGQGAPAVAKVMHLSRKTVNAYCARIKAKIGVTNMAELLREAVRFEGDQAKRD
jgi:DNA-binding CsgD family transcriptional regulator